MVQLFHTKLESVLRQVASSGSMVPSLVELLRNTSLTASLQQGLRAGKWLLELTVDYGNNERKDPRSGYRKQATQRKVIHVTMP